MTAVALVSSALLLAVAVVPSVTNRESQRDLDQVPQLATAAANPAHVGYLEIHGHYRAETLKRVLLGGASATAPIPPGLPRIPAPGEVFLSPRLRHLMADDPRLAGWFPQRYAGQIAPAGLVTPDQMLAYVGVPAAAFRPDQQSYAIAFGALPSSSASQTGARWYQVAGFGLLVAIPAIVAFLAASRAGAQVRRRRARAMSIAGMSRAAISSVGFAEAAMPALIGTVIGTILFSELAPRIGRIPITHRAITADDIRVSLPMAAAVIVGLTLLAGLLSSASAIRAAHLDRSNRPARPRPRLSVIPALLFVTGLVLLVISAVRAIPLDPLLRPALVLAAIGLPLAASALSKLVGRTASARWPVPALIAFRRLHRDPGAASTLVAVIAVMTFALSSAIPVVRDQTASMSWKSLVGDSIVVRGTSLAPTLPLRPHGSLPSNAHAALAVGIWNPSTAHGTPPTGRALIASCAELAELLGQAVPGCSDDSPSLVGSAADNPASRTFQLRSAVTGGAPITLPPTTRTLNIPSAGAVPVDVSAVIPPATAALAHTRHLFVTAVYARIPSTSPAIDQFRAYVIGGGPAYMVDVPAQEVITTDTVASWILLAIMTCAILTLLAALALSTTQGRDTSEHALETLAAPARTRLSTAMLTAGTTAAIGATLAVGCGLLASLAYTRAAIEPLPPAGQYLQIWIVAILAGAILGMLGEALGRRVSV